MVKMAISEAEAHLQEVVERIEQTGESVTVTRRGVPVVEIVPCRPPRAVKRSREEIFAEIDAIRQKLPPITLTEIREAIDEGRE